MRNLLLTIAYDGTRYFGWQKTPMGPSIEQEMTEVLQRILQHPITLQAASRTDRGVHAEGQVVNFFTPKEHLALDTLQYGMNGLLPGDIRVLSVQDALSMDFHATLDNTSKEYRYRIASSETLWPFWRNTHWHFPYPLDREKMKGAAKMLVGTHDFIAFRNTRKNQDNESTVRTIFSIDLVCVDSAIEIQMRGDNFLYKMARNLVGTIVYIGGGKMSLEKIPSLFQNPNRIDGAITAPACGLTLFHISY